MAKNQWTAYSLEHELQNKPIVRTSAFIRCYHHFEVYSSFHHHHLTYAQSGIVFEVNGFKLDFYNLNSK